MSNSLSSIDHAAEALAAMSAVPAVVETIQTDAVRSEERAVGAGWSELGHIMSTLGWSLSDDTFVTEQDALTASAVWACVNVIASGIGTLPIHLRERETEKKVHSHAVSQLLRTPNEFMVWPDFCEALLLNLLMSGNGLAVVERDKSFRPTSILPLKSACVGATRKNGELIYQVQVNGHRVNLRQEDILHVKHLSFDGLWGMSPITYAAGSLNLTLSLEKFARVFFKNGANIGNVIELPAGMKTAELTEFKRLWREQYEGVHNAHRTAAAPGLKVHKAGHSPKEAQAIESRVHQLREVSRIYQVPPHKLYDLENAHFKNIEDQSRDFAENTLRRWVVKLEASMEHLLLREDERERFKIRFNLDAAVRASLEVRAEADAKLVLAGIKSQNEARSDHNLPPKEGGDVLLVPMNMTPAGSVADKSTPPDPDEDE